MEQRQGEEVGGPPSKWAAGDADERKGLSGDMLGVEGPTGARLDQSTVTWPAALGTAITMRQLATN